LLTFSNQARTQLEREAAQQLPPATRKRVEVSNYHRFFWRAVLAYRRALGLPMELDIGSPKRRQKALEDQAGRGLVRGLSKHSGLVESLAEHAHEPFRDERTPASEDLERLLAAISNEQRAGRLVFDDLGALFWELLEHFPSVERAYLARYPVVIADEHQDASALQDAVARRLGRERLVVFADPMQLIHGFRGASVTRLRQHQSDCDAEATLSTAHRWHGSGHLARWLLEVRSRLLGETHAVDAPEELRIRQTQAAHGFNAVKPEVKYAVAHAFKDGHRSVAVLARANNQVGQLRGYLSREGFRPRQIGSVDFEDAREDIEQLPLLRDSKSVALHAVTRIEQLISTMPKAALDQARKRIHDTEIHLSGAGADAKLILEPLAVIYEGGPGRYFEGVMAAVRSATDAGHHSPRTEALRALGETAEVFAGGTPELEEALQQYSRSAMAASQTAPRINRGLFVMTAHQAKGKEFDAIVLAEASSRFFPDDEDARHLFYVAITRASKSWTVIAPDAGASPLLTHLGS